MFKKIILIWMLIFASLFSSGDDFITTLPRKEKAYLDIEITKISTEDILDFDIDYNNKIITLKNKNFDSSSQSLILTENPNVFDALFSVNGRIENLKKLSKETNLSNIISDHNIMIKYKDFPNKFFVGVWSKKQKSLTKIYVIAPEIKPFLFSLNGARNGETINIRPNEDLHIDLGKLYIDFNFDLGAGQEITLSFPDKPILNINGIDGNFGSYYKFKNPDGRLTDTLSAKHFYEINNSNYSCVLIIPKETINKLIQENQNNIPIISVAKVDAHFKNGKHLGTITVKNDFSVTLQKDFDIIYHPGPFHLTVPSTNYNNVALELGKLEIKNSNDNYRIQIPNNLVLVLNTPSGPFEYHGGQISFSTNGSSYFNSFSVNKGVSYSCKIIGYFPKSTIDSIFKKINELPENANWSLYTKGQDPRIDIQPNIPHQWNPDRPPQQILINTRPIYNIEISDILIDFGDLYPGENKAINNIPIGITVTDQMGTVITNPSGLKIMLNGNPENASINLTHQENKTDKLKVDLYLNNNQSINASLSTTRESSSGVYNGTATLTVEIE